MSRNARPLKKSQNDNTESRAVAGTNRSCGPDMWDGIALESHAQFATTAVYLVIGEELSCSIRCCRQAARVFEPSKVPRQPSGRGPKPKESVHLGCRGALLMSICYGDVGEYAAATEGCAGQGLRQGQDHHRSRPVDDEVGVDVEGDVRSEAPADALQGGAQPLRILV